MDLDDTLRAWAAQEVTLPTPIVDDVFRQVVASSPGLDTRWWTRFSGRLAANVVASTRPRIPVTGVR
ncbi:hypothetical protein [Paractinoplanes lichenicola]|uniref:Uncharacterized protein n=1 Tax=Paractinoplanes lichenicola TaxID=2802976 RepID=A0ABS1VPS2_9ACTN|nr:hypothetical protein [Actinoplanes lichenicola]MBL7255747.1 hypothetical protein [Actinoplanes lichenicola]